MKTQNTTPRVFMRDFADDDPRSVQASIEGRDDGRAGRYERYFKRHLDPTQTYSVNEIYQAGMRAANLPEATVPRSMSLLGRALTSVAGLALGALVVKNL